MPSIYEIENLLSGSEAIIKDLSTIKAIGTYLEAINYTEEDEGRHIWRSRKALREKAIKLMGMEEINATEEGTGV